MKSPIVTFQVENKGTNTNPVNIKTQEEDKPVEVKTYSEVATTNISSEDPSINQVNSIPNRNHILLVNQAINTTMLKRN